MRRSDARTVRERIAAALASVEQGRAVSAVNARKRAKAKIAAAMRETLRARNIVKLAGVLGGSPGTTPPGDPIEEALRALRDERN